MAEFQRELSAVEDYLLWGNYPNKYSKAEKASPKSCLFSNGTVEIADYSPKHLPQRSAGVKSARG